MDYPTEEAIRAMTNAEFVSLMRTQAALIDRTVNVGSDRPAHGDAKPGER
jgi:hypothetical protein